MPSFKLEVLADATGDAPAAAAGSSAALAEEGAFTGLERGSSRVFEVLAGLGSGAAIDSGACFGGAAGSGGGVGWGMGAERARFTRTCTLGACRIVARNNSFTLRVSA
jgi:hypothetical protein